MSAALAAPPPVSLRRPVKWSAQELHTILMFNHLPSVPPLVVPAATVNVADLLR